MFLAYQKQTFINEETVLTAEMLDHIEEGIVQNEKNIAKKVSTTELDNAVDTALTEAKESGEFDGEDGYTPQKGIDYFDGEDGKSAYEYAQDGGYAGTEEEFAEKLARKPYKTSVKDYGAKGDGSTDDTEFFQAALAENRLVYVPEGTYKLSNTLVVRPNCEFELSQATHLKFTQTSGNCIELRSSATLRGNHAVIGVPYSFTGNVISADTQYDEGTRDTPPFAHYDPMWKRARYIYDVCIVKPNSAGLHCSIDGICSGTGIYLSAKGKHLTEGGINYIWGAMLQGVRIAGAFTYGINIYNIDNPDDSTEDDAWNHDMRIEAVLQGCETGVNVFNCNLVRLAVSIQPSTADGNATYKGTKYAKWGVRLEDCKNIDMSSSFIWDWQAARTDSEEYTRIAMFGNCPGLIVSDYLYHSDGIDIRKNTYTDRQSNLEKMTILQEPITRWFKPIDNLPFFSDGSSNKQLLFKEDFDICFQTDNVSNFTDELARATDLNGNIYNGIGYEVGVGYIASNGMDMANEYYGRTGFIKCKTNSIINVDGIKITPEDGWSGVLLYTSDKNLRSGGWISSYNFLTNNSYYYTDDYVETENGFSFRIVASDVEYIRFTTRKGEFGTKPVVAVNEEISYSQAGFLADGIKVKAENVIGLPSGGKSVQADLSQNDETQPDYVKGRTHWSEYEEVTLPDNVLLESYGNLETDFPLVLGQEYKVTHNGVESVETAQSSNVDGTEIIYIGNPAAFGGDDNGKTFAVVYLAAANTTMIVSMIEEQSTITIKGTQEIIHTIPSKYLAGSLAYIIKARNYGVNVENEFTVFETAEELKNILFSGGVLVLRVFIDVDNIFDYTFFGFTNTDVTGQLFEFGLGNSTALIQYRADGSVVGGIYETQQST